MTGTEGKEVEIGEEILLKSLKKLGISIPQEISSIQTTCALLSICVQCLHKIDQSLLSFHPKTETIDDCTTEAKMFDMCAEISAGFEKLGYNKDNKKSQISFHQLLYPSKDDSYNLIRFLMEKLSDKLLDCADGSSTLGKNEGEETAIATMLNEKLASLRAISFKMRNEIQILHNQGEVLKHELSARVSESQHLESKHELFTAAVKMALDDQHPIEFHVDELKKQLETDKQKHEQLELHWNASVKPLEERKREVEELPQAQKAQIELMVKKVKQVDLETDAIILEIKRSEEVRIKLSSELETKPKAAFRKSYIERISEITKNSRKQDADIGRILNDTRDLQIESNSIQERLHRTYVVVEEAILRDVKNDLVRQQAHGLLIAIHESFGDISEQILITDRIRREAVELETKLSAASTSTLAMDRLQANLDALRKEEKLLWDPLHH
ncbi:Coiled-coil domain-containing protein [Thalictrum thalictroides]|uniref:Coiled-coil domain-containing protein n=1 Tax=Thalictrum thalictroides TaxID=46969 RepID=A0A7J6WIM9_THATH|nr:Coiled-coil domain-containing protein [Thalictrum thalictroides]